jgi:hypothetical protein
VIGDTNGTTITFTRAGTTAQNILSKAGIEGSMTIKEEKRERSGAYIAGGADGAK